MFSIFMLKFMYLLEVTVFATWPSVSLSAILSIVCLGAMSRTEYVLIVNAKGKLVKKVTEKFKCLHSHQYMHHFA